MAKAFGKKLQAINNSDKYIDSLSSTVPMALLNLHKEVDRFFASQINVCIQDRNLKATERMDAVLEGLKNTKRVCIDLLQGYDTIGRFVESPLSHQKRKTANAKSNKRRAEINAKAKESLEKMKVDDQVDESPFHSDAIQSPSSTHQHQITEID